MTGARISHTNFGLLEIHEHYLCMCVCLLKCCGTRQTLARLETAHARDLSPADKPSKLTFARRWAKLNVQGQWQAALIMAQCFLSILQLIDATRKLIAYGAHDGLINLGFAVTICFHQNHHHQPAHA